MHSEDAIVYPSFIRWRVSSNEEKTAYLMESKPSSYTIIRELAKADKTGVYIS